MSAAADISAATNPIQETLGRITPPDRLIAPPKIIGAVLLFDVAAVMAFGLLTYAYWLDAELWGDSKVSFLVAVAVVIGAMAILKARWSYTIAALSSPWRQAADITVALLVVFGALLVFTVFVADDLTPFRRWVSVWFLGSWVACLIFRLLLARKLKDWSLEGRLARRTVIVGGGEPAQKLIERLERSGCAAIQILGLFDDRDKQRSPEMVGRYCKLGRFDDLVDFCREHRIDLMIVALPPTAEERILHILKSLWVLPVDVRIAALDSKLKLRSRAYNYIGDVPFLPVFDKPMSDWSVALKSIEDRVLAGLGLVVLSPLLALIALAVKLESRGPVFFMQRRHGFNNEAIEVYKFRSMYVDQCDYSGTKIVTRGDPRVTRVGALLRRSSLDELPQLVNVVKGELSLVGPRPHALQAAAEGKIYDQVVDGYFARHKVKPGITGWAQVNGWRGETDTVEKIEQRVAHDIYYIENWSMLFDLRILLMTPLSLITTKNAY